MITLNLIKRNELPQIEDKRTKAKLLLKEVSIFISFLTSIDHWSILKLTQFYSVEFFYRCSLRMTQVIQPYLLI